MDVNTPKVTGMTVADAKKALDKKNLKYRTVGEGESITAQLPAAGASVPGGSTVVLYLGDAVPEESGTVPDVVGMSYEGAKTASDQSILGGETAAMGTVVDVQFSNIVEDGAVDSR